MKRPLKNKRVFGPVIDLNSSSGGDVEVGGEFKSIDDLPDSPMLKEYVERQIEYTGLDEKTVINSDPVKNYMERLGVWERSIN